MFHSRHIRLRTQSNPLPRPLQHGLWQYAGLYPSGLPSIFAKFTPMWSTMKQLIVVGRIADKNVVNIVGLTWTNRQHRTRSIAGPMGFRGRIRRACMMSIAFISPQYNASFGATKHLHIGLQRGTCRTGFYHSLKHNKIVPQSADRSNSRPACKIRSRLCRIRSVRVFAAN